MKVDLTHIPRDFFTFPGDHMDCYRSRFALLFLEAGEGEVGGVCVLLRI
jgi:hypothetical protein